MREMAPRVKDEKRALELAYRRALRISRVSRGQPEAVASLTYAARRNQPVAQYALGSWFLHGIGVQKNLRRALALFAKAAAAGHPDAAFNLARAYEVGEGRKKNARRAFQLYQRAAAHGDVGALVEVARCLFFGIGTRPDRAAADKLYARAARLGNAEARATRRPRSKRSSRRSSSADPRSLRH